MVFFGSNYSYPIHQGVAAFAGEHGWHLGFRIQSPHDEGLDVEGWDALIIATAVRASLLRGLLGWKCPAINLSASPSEVKMPRVVGDNREIGRLAARHFLELGYWSFAYFSLGTRESESLRRAGFQDELGAAGQAAVYCCLGSQDGAAAACSWKNEKAWLSDSLKGLRKPVAVFCFNDLLAGHVLDAALDLGFMVPEEVAIVGTDNDPLFCERAAVPLSSVRHDLFHLGYHGAEVLDGLMTGRPVPEEPVLIKPDGLEIRRSSNHFATRNRALMSALRFIREHFRENIGVEDIVRATSLSLRGLQHAFQRELRRSIRQEINRLRFEYATSLLRDTELAVSDVAAQCGFQSLEYFCRSFKSRYGNTALAFRRAAKACLPPAASLVKSALPIPREVCPDPWVRRQVSSDLPVRRPGGLRVSSELAT
ncbi:MAG: DNA-binding transcriptional regulator [Verrucomicrobia bacterium]|nr:DNA-binding transcriptional regulator [Verrucomicrobiota bacterium]